MSTITYTYIYIYTHISFKTAEEESREQIEELINNEEPVKEAIIETIIEEEEIKPKAKAKTKSRAKPKIKITKEPVEEAIQKNEEEPIIEEQPAPVKVDKLKKIVQCPDCGLSMTQHTLLYTHKRRGSCKAEKAPEKAPEPVPEPRKPKVTEEVVNDYIKQNPDTVSNYLRNERAMKAQRKQRNARCLLNNVCLVIYNKRCRIRRKQLLELISLMN